MTMIVEDGTGLPNANSYAAVAATNTYFTDRGIDTWTNATTTAREQALIKATDYIDANYIFLSVPLTDTQSLANPRYNQGITLKSSLVKATMELALVFLSAAPSNTAVGPAIVIKELQADGVGYSKVQYTQTAVTPDPYPTITKILRPIAKGRVGAGASTVMMTK